MATRKKEKKDLTLLVENDILIVRKEHSTAQSKEAECP